MARGLIGRAGVEWSGLAILSFALSYLFVAASLPGSILIGPMLAAIAFGLAGSERRVARPVFTVAQGVVGCLIAGSITSEILREVVRDWPILLFGVTVTIAASSAVGWVLARFGTLPGSTAAWGSSPGAASAMVAMAGEFGADVRLVATMQYVRVICVVLAASLVSRVLLGGIAPVQIPQAAAAPASLDLLGLGATLAVAVAGSWLGRRLRVPAGGILVPLGIAAAINAAGAVHLAPPAWLLAFAYYVIGWTIGLQFERVSLGRSVRALPEILAASFALMALCGAAAWIMVRLTGLTPLTAFLATSPGGIDTVAIIALSGGADTPFVMAMQTLRLLTVVAAGPAIARLLTRTTKRDGQSGGKRDDDGGNTTPS
ncbi:AbrB family transcriptional regulator [uncultured Enterovirga sp.]|uniref:AbrB family transcriptional regulator n=1 Tax=uncultured Enterovirga sp. TaxID=2026352 RepID=UPI0035CB2584